MEYLNKYLVKSSATAHRVVDGEAVIVLPMEGSVKILNDVGTRIWELADGFHSVEDIVQEINREFEVTAAVAQDDAVEFIKEMVSGKMLELQ